MNSKQTLALIAIFSCGGMIQAQESILRASVPDYDQRRSVLPRNGSMYCVPTSYVNIFRYMADHGMPDMNGSYNTSYGDVSNWILSTGVHMGTDAVDGTRATPAFDYASHYIWNRTSHAVYMYKFSSDADWGVNTIRNWLRLGAMVAMGRGRYEWDGNDYDRVGGHVMTLVGYTSDGNGNRTLKVMNPSMPNDGNLTTQSTFAVETKGVANVTVDTEDDGVVTHAQYSVSGNPNFYMIDNMHVMLPCFAGWPSNTNDSTRFTFQFPFQWDEAAFGWPKTFTHTTTDSIVDWQWDAKNATLFYVNSAGNVKEVDIFDNTSTTITTISGANRILLGGPMHDLYVLGKAVLAPDKIYRFDRKTGRVSSTNVGFAPGALDYDEFSGGPVVANTAGTVFKRYSPTLSSSTILTTRRLQSILPTLMAPIFMKVDHLTGDILTGIEGNSGWTRYIRQGSRYVGVDIPFRGGGIQAIMPGETGQVYVQSNNVLSTYNRYGIPAPGDFDGLAVSGRFKMIRSGPVGTNPMDTPAWNNEDALEVP